MNEKHVFCFLRIPVPRFLNRKGLTLFFWKSMFDREKSTLEKKIIPPLCIIW